MKIRRTARFLQSYQDAPVSVKKAFEKQVRYLAKTSAILPYVPRNTTSS
jgi:hypothetical protein